MNYDKKYIREVIAETLTHIGLGSFQFEINEEIDGQISCVVKTVLTFNPKDAYCRELSILTKEIASSELVSKFQERAEKMQKYKDYFELALEMEIAKVGKK